MSAAATKTVRIHAVVQFYAEAPTDDLAGDAWADDVSDAIVSAVNGIGTLGVYGESAAVVDRTEHVE